ncbi:MAG: hypothetical protein Q8P90_00965 [bacterium]|nr:hypothetical protein [bacterium]
MILDKPIDPNKVKALSEADQITLAKQAYAEFLKIVDTISDEQKEILEKALKNVEAKKIAEIQQEIQSS